MYWPTEVIPIGQQAIRPLSNKPFPSRSIPAHSVRAQSGQLATRRLHRD